MMRRIFFLTLKLWKTILAPFFGKAHERLPFYRTAKVLEAEPYSCLFCVSRLRASFIPKLLNLRKKISEKFKKDRLIRSYIRMMKFLCLQSGFDLVCNVFRLINFLRTIFPYFHLRIWRGF